LVTNATAGGDLTGSGIVPRGFGFVLSGEAIGPSGRVVGCVVCLSDGVVGRPGHSAGLSGGVVGPSDRAVGCVAGLSSGVVGLSGGVVGLSGGVVGLSSRVVGLSGLSGRVVGLPGGWLGGVVGLAGRVVALSGCSFDFSFFSCSAVGELVSPARKANASPAASQRDFDFK